MDFRIGQGYDVHVLAPGETLVLGGVLIPYHVGTVAHSDGDVLVHALCDALLGALSLGDIGRHFPDSSSAFRNIDSMILLQRVVAMVHGQGWEVSNADSTLVLQAPKVAPFIPEMKTRLAQTLGITADRVSVKATTTERLGFVGRGEGVEAQAVVLLKALPGPVGEDARSPQEVRPSPLEPPQEK